MYIRTSYSDFVVLKKAIDEFFDILCDDECREFQLMIGKSDDLIDITILGEIDDYTSHNLIGWLGHPGGWNDSFEVTGTIKFGYDIHHVTPDLNDELGEHLLCQKLDGEKYRFNVPECKKVPGDHDVDLIAIVKSPSRREHLDTLSPMIN